MTTRGILGIALLTALIPQSPTLAAGNAAVEIDGLTFESWTDYFTSDYFREHGKRCATPEVTDVDGEYRGGSASDCSFSLTNPLEIYAPEVVTYHIPVVVHIIAPSIGHAADIPDERVHEQIQILNEDFNAIFGSNGANGTNCNVRFCLATVDPQGNPATGITRSYNATWFNDGGSYWNSLAWDPNRYLNIYTNNASGNLGYVPFLPQSGSPGSLSDRVVCLYSAFGLTTFTPYHLGRTATHEVGHYMGLFHTFEGACASATPPACYSSGDRICDTESESAPEFACSTTPSCGTPDPIHNYMDYSYDSCMDQFTFEQARRLRCTLEHYRPNLWGWSSCDLVAVDQPAIAPRSPVALHQNAPNPFNPTTEITFEMTASGQVTLEILDVNGRIVRTLAQEHRPAGTHRVNWDGTGGDGLRVASGVYFYRLTTGALTQTRRMVLLK